jgi:aldose sugar dehydrogenase
MKLILLGIFFSATLPGGCSGPAYKSVQGNNAAIKDSVLAAGLNYPWEILWGPDNYIWMTERGGKISRINPSTGVVTKLLDVPGVASRGEGGLLGMVLHPDFAVTPYVFVAYNYEADDDYKEKIVRYSYNGTALTNPLVIFDDIKASYIHNGCRLLITADKKLLVSTGDASDQSLPQNKNAVNGKILRLNLDGTIPADNPFAGNPVWSYGHRNAQGMVLANDKLYISEHGPDTDDEVSIVIKGGNYGWPDVKGFCNERGEKEFCTKKGVTEPVYAWTPTIAVCGLDYYNSDLIPGWKNSLLMATLKNERLHQLQLDDSYTTVKATFTFLDEKYGRLRDVCVSPDGHVYVCTSNGSNDDKLVVISPK